VTIRDYIVGIIKDAKLFYIFYTFHQAGFDLKCCSYMKLLGVRVSM
jgi:hypothetical protein